MKLHHLPLAILVFIGSVAGAQPVWKPDLFCVKFNVRSIAGDINGTIKGLEGKLMIDSARPEKSWLTARVETGTISTNNRARDNYFSKADYFNATAYPRITIVSVSIKKKRDDLYTATCDLTIKGTTRRIDIPFTFTRTGDRCAFAGTFTLDRLDYKIGKSTMMLANRVTVCLIIDGQVNGDASSSYDLTVR